jgi:guanylate kinase
MMPDGDPFSRKPNPLLIVISGPSGVGKDVTIHGLQEQGYHFHFVVTATSRPKRQGEIDGKDYFFVSEEEFERMVEQNELLEHALVYGQYKGIPKAQVRRALDSGLDVIMRVDVQGAATVRRLVPDAVFVFLTPGSEEELVSRLNTRASESPDHLRQRLDRVRQEMEQIDQFDYMLVNREGQLDRTVAHLLAVITAEKCRVRQREIRL